MRRLVPNFEASLREGFPGNSRETPTPSAAPAAQHHRYWRPPRRGRCLRSRAQAAAAGGQAALCGGAGRGFLPHTPRRAARQFSLPPLWSCHEQGCRRRRWQREPQTGSAAEIPGPPRKRGPPARARPPSLAHPPRHLPTQAVRAILETHTPTHRHSRTHTRTGARFPLLLPETTGSSRARAGKEEQRQQRERDTHTHPHAPRAGQKCAFQVI